MRYVYEDTSPVAGGQPAAILARRCIVVVSYPYFTLQPSVKGMSPFISL